MCEWWLVSCLSEKHIAEGGGHRAGKLICNATRFCSSFCMCWQFYSLSVGILVTHFMVMEKYILHKAASVTWRLIRKLQDYVSQFFSRYCIVCVDKFYSLSVGILVTHRLGFKWSRLYFASNQESAAAANQRCGSDEVAIPRPAESRRPPVIMDGTAPTRAVLVPQTQYREHIGG